MKTTYIICAAGIAVAIAMFSEPLTAKAPEAKPEIEVEKVAAREQKLVRIYESSSMLMKGDPYLAESKDGHVLPMLLADGWEIVKLDTDAAGGERYLITTGYVLLER